MEGETTADLACLYELLLLAMERRVGAIGGAGPAVRAAHDPLYVDIVRRLGIRQLEDHTQLVGLARRDDGLKVTASQTQRE